MQNHFLSFLVRCKTSPCKARLLLVFVAFVVLFVPVTAQSESPTFAIISDTHVGAPNSTYPSVVRQLEEDGIATIIHTGDAINKAGDLSQWAEFSAESGPEKVYLTPGNHDIRDPKSFSTYLGRYHSPFYAFSDGDTLFVMLNTEIPGQRRKITGEQLTWLKVELDRPFRYKFVFLHEPLYPLLPFNGLDRHRSDRNALHQLFVEKGVSLVVAGHDHVYNRKVKDGVEYVVQGAVGGRLPWFTKGSESFRYITATRRGDGYSFVVKDLAGSARDEFSIRSLPAETVRARSGTPTVLARVYRFLAHRIPTLERL
jgi:3',5'-cyclic AMP phosphodiesterase CpdA